MNEIEINDSRRKDFYIVDNAAVYRVGKIIGAFGCAVYNSLSCHSNNKGECWPSIERIAEEWNIGRTKVMESIDKLISLNMVTVTKELGKRNLYRLINKTEWKYPDNQSATRTGNQSATRTGTSPPHGHEQYSFNNTQGNNTQEEISAPFSVETHKELASLLFEEILNSNPHNRIRLLTPTQKQKKIDRWADDIRLLIVVDKESPETIRKIIPHALGDPFWARNLLSGNALRRNWDRLTAEFMTPIRRKTNDRGRTGAGKSFGKAGYFGGGEGSRDRRYESDIE
jgi:hypothetical protein